MTDDRNELRSQLRERFPRDRGQLLPALHFLQHEFGYLPDWGMEVVGWHLGVPSSEVYGAATTYSELRVRKPGKHILKVCTGLSCWINGGGELSDAAAQELGARPGDTTGDGRVTFEETACGFLCAMAPAVQWDGTWIGHATVDSVESLAAEARDG
jgi:NADH:ubiquinone oxidoreductase subunit E